MEFGLWFSQHKQIIFKRTYPSKNSVLDHWIMHKPFCKQYSFGLLSFEKIALMKTVDMVFCGLSV